MKKIFFLVMSFVLIFGCQKANDGISVENAKRVINSPILDLLENPDDIDDEAVNFKLYEWAILLKNNHLQNGQTEYNRILSALSANIHHTMSFDDLGISWDQNETFYNGTAYVPVVWLYNNDSCSTDEEPYLLIGTDVDAEEIDIFVGADEDDDFIPGWNLITNDTVVINENDADTIKGPIFIVTLQPVDQDIDNTQPLLMKKGPAVESEDGYKRFFIKEYKLDQRHDRTKRSEYRMILFVKMDSLKYSDYWLKIARVHKNDIGTWLTINNLDNIIAPASSPVNMLKIPEGSDVLLYGITYEHDWFATKKLVLDPNYVYRIRSKYPESYYQRYPYISLTYLQDQDVDVNSEGGGMKIQRID